MVHLPELLENYGDLAEFLFIYTDETGTAMATHDHQLPQEIEQFAEPAGAPRGSRLRLEERVRAGMKHFGLRMPFLLDTERRKARSLYGANSKRLLIVDPAGRIAVDSGNVPSHDFPWQEITDWLDHYGESVSAHKHS